MCSPQVIGRKQIIGRKQSLRSKGGGVMTTRAGFPDGTELRLARGTRVLDGGRVLVGGSPARVTRLKPAAAGLLERRRMRVTDAATASLADYLTEAGLADPDPHTLPAPDLGELTVVIPAYRRARPLDRLLAGIRDDLGDVRVIVVDDASPTDGAALAASARRHGAELVVLPHNGGPAVARNAGLARAETEFVLFIDTDAVLRPGAIGMLLRHFADPRLAAAAPRVAGLSQPDENWVLQYETARSSLDHGGDGGLVRPLTPMSWVSSTCLLVRRSAVGGGFDARMRVGEDVDLVWRLHAEGWRVRYEPEAVVEHEHRAAAGSWLARKFVYGTGAAPLARRHPGLTAPAVLAPWAVAALAALAAQRRWSLPAAAVIVAGMTVQVARRVGAVPHPYVLATRLTLSGFGWAITQGFALLVRHWWPLAAVWAVASRRGRRAVAFAAVADAAWEYLRLRPGTGFVRFALARRLDDLAYGAGVWWSAIRDRSLAPLLPIIRRRDRR